MLIALLLVTIKNFTVGNNYILRQKTVYVNNIDFGIEDEIESLNNYSDSALDIEESAQGNGIRYKVVDNKWLVYKGRFHLTHYCKCSICCGPYANGITASGRYAQAGVSIAVDRNKISLGSDVYIEGYGTRRADDTGGAIKNNRIDVYVDSHSEALRLGVKKGVDVWSE